MEIVAVTERGLSVRPFVEQIMRIASAGVDMLVLREKDLSPWDYRGLAVLAKSVCEAHGVSFCVNTFVDIASNIGADTVWIPYPRFIENGRPSIRRVGVSVHSLEEARRAESGGADFLIYGNVFETSCKPGMGAKGFDELDSITGSVLIPVYAIGGIDTDNASLMGSHNVRGICLRSAFMTAEEPTELVKKLRLSTS